MVHSNSESVDQMFELFELSADPRVYATQVLFKRRTMIRYDSQCSSEAVPRPTNPHHIHRMLFTQGMERVEDKDPPKSCRVLAD